MKIKTKLFENIFIYFNVNESLYSAKPLYLVFTKINGYVEDHDGG